MEATTVASDNEPIGDRTVAVGPSEEGYAALDVFGTEAFDSVCGVDILDPHYRPDVKRAISLWSVLLLVGTTVLTLGFFGCFRRLKGDNLDLSRNLWNEDLFWTSLIHFLLTCFAVTCGLSALAGHTNLYSHAKVLGFRRVFRWCLTLHAVAAVFMLVVALKLTVIDVFEPESGVAPTTQEKTPEEIADTRRFKHPKNVYVYLRGPHRRKTATSSSLTARATSLLQKTSVSARVPKSARNADMAASASSRVATAEAHHLSAPDVPLVPLSAPPVPESSREATKPLRGPLVDASVQRKESARNEALRRRQTWKAKKDISRVALRHSNSLRQAMVRPCPTSTLQSQGGVEEDYSGALMPDFAGAYAQASPSPRGNESSADCATRRAHPHTPCDKEAGEQSFVSHASVLNVLPDFRGIDSGQQSHTATQTRSRHRGASASELKIHPKAHFPGSSRCPCTDRSSAEEPSPISHRKDVESDTFVGHTAALLTAGMNDSVFGRTVTEGPVGKQHQQQAHASFFLEDEDDQEESSGEPGDRSTASGVNNELRPIRDSRVYRLMLDFVVALDYSAAVLHVACVMHTSHLASKIGGMFGLKILKVPF